MLNEREEQILKAIMDYNNKNGFNPSIREIGEIVGLKSSSTVHKYLGSLEEKGYIERKENCPRALKVVKSL